MATAGEYDVRATVRIRELLDEQHAVVRRELESRLAEGYWPTSGQNINPHHVTNALRYLTNADEVEWISEQTRGGAWVRTLQPTDRIGRADKIDRAAARKRLLYARYLGWATGNRRHPKGLIGPAGEAAVRSAILQSGAVLPTLPGAAAVARPLGVSLPGPLDSAGVTVPFTPGGVPGAAVSLLFEVKNVRQWIYPSASEPFQLLSKAVLVQQAQPDASIVPVLVCRKAHVTLFWMAKQLGFFVIDLESSSSGRLDEDRSSRSATACGSPTSRWRRPESAGRRPSTDRRALLLW